MIKMLDQQAMKLGVTRQSIIKFWISEKLKSMELWPNMVSKMTKYLIPGKHRYSKFVVTTN